MDLAFNVPFRRFLAVRPNRADPIDRTICEHPPSAVTTPLPCAVFESECIHLGSCPYNSAREKQKVNMSLPRCVGEPEWNNHLSDGTGAPWKGVNHGQSDLQCSFESRSR